MNKKQYKEYLQTERWKSLAKMVKNHWGNRCAMCYEDGQLDCHHRTYERLGEERFTDLIPLCRNCHENHHIMDINTRSRFTTEDNNEFDVYSKDKEFLGFISCFIATTFNCKNVIVPTSTFHKWKKAFEKMDKEK